MLLVRILIFYVGYYLILLLWVLFMLGIAVWLPLRWRTGCCYVFYLSYEIWLKLCLNIRVHYEYASSLSPGENYIIMANHQTEWEAFALIAVRRPTVIVLKDELMRLPFFGWAVAILDPIVIQRDNLVESMRRIYIQGSQKLAQGYSLVIFPQGTRVAPPKLGKCNPSAARMALATGKSLVLIAHNSGEHIPQGLSAASGTINVKVSAPISPQGHTKDSLYRKAIEMMERMMEEVHQNGAAR